MKRYLTRFSFIIAVATLAFTGNLQAEQPHMDAALDNLRAARKQLENAKADKGGHRARAISIIDQAIAEVKAGIVAGRK
ncbi:MAG: hypothetical protein ACAI35_05435 [Candidatus Methylacidiphilales bacterium]|nr:hypothetical protein [Candidatus Methylacidiphilales bacterium]